MNIRKAFYILLLTLIAATLVNPANLHQFHMTLARIDFNAEEKLYEVSIKIFTHDLLPILERKSGKRVELRKSNEADKLIFDYLNENFVLTDKKDAVKTLKWVGKEVDADSVRVYVESAANENPEGYKLKNTLFFESQPEQVNLVVCTFGGKKADLMFKAGDKIKEITENKTAPEK